MATTRIVYLLLAITLIPACAWHSEEGDKTRNWSASKFYTEASRAMKRGNYETAIELYEKLEARFPFGRYATQAQLDIAYVYYNYDEPDAALAAFDRFIKLHPRSPHVDYAYYMKGIVNFNNSLGIIERFLPSDTSQRDAGAAMDSFDDFSELVRRFPTSKYSKDAQKRLIYLRNNLARYEVHVAEYYMDRGAYLAAANRSVYVVENFQRTPSVRDALKTMIKAYDKLGMDKLSADASRVLAVNQKTGTFDYIDEDAAKAKPLGRKVWDFMGLDKN
ncbi:Outer membrane beta-barrel assembly protein BamD [hydrothermal vent metagenome]|uniref:Outer membrane beta-barrel assembly protein BamD n=1 Tax=hydrothermal vent metagenome TaxID=652676 RepID=A0A3B1AHL5_9ZZZZ